MDDEHELLDLVDANDHPIGSLRRQEILGLEESGKGFARAAGVFLVNDKGELWVPRRSIQKKIAPGGLDFSAGEHVTQGESYEKAAVRGMEEELHIQVRPEELTPTGVVPPFPGMPYFHHIFTYAYDKVPAYNRGDYAGYEWIDPAGLLKRLEKGEPAKEILLPAVKLLVVR